MKRLILLLLVSLICSAYPLWAQQSVSEEATVLFRQETKYAQGTRRVKQVLEAKELIAEKYRIEKRIKEISIRLTELDKDVEPGEPLAVKPCIAPSECWKYNPTPHTIISEPVAGAELFIRHRSGL